MFHKCTKLTYGMSSHQCQTLSWTQTKFVSEIFRHCWSIAMSVRLCFFLG